MKKMFAYFIAVSVMLFANSNDTKQECLYKADNGVSVEWKAYKTPEKIGVGGTFDTVVYQAATKQAGNIRDLLLHSSVKIETKSVNSNNKGRDQKLVTAFFSLMTGDKIVAKIIEVSEHKLVVSVEMNGIEKKVPMHYSYQDGKLHAEGVIDLFDFQASKALQRINKACYALHKGKTWNDVSIGFKMHIPCVPSKDKK